MLRSLFSLSCLAIAACGSPTGPGGLRLDLIASTTTIAHGETVTLTMTVENRSPSPRTITGSSSCTFRWVQEEVNQRSACTADLRDWVFAPFETRTFVFEWDGFLRDIEGQRFPATPGPYRIRGVLDATEGEGRTDPVTVTVTAP